MTDEDNDVRQRTNSIITKITTAFSQCRSMKAVFAMENRKMLSGRRQRRPTGWLGLLLVLSFLAYPGNSFLHIHITTPLVHRSLSYNQAALTRTSCPRLILDAVPADVFGTIFPDGVPFDSYANQLNDMLDIGGARVSETATSAVLASVGRDLLVFLLASVIVTPFASFIGISPILGYLLAGALLGPNGLDFFSNTKADVELGDFGILFLLFSEGLEVTKPRLRKLANYLPLGAAQISLTAGTMTAAILAANPYYLERFVPLDAGLIDVQNPIEALVLALAGTLSTSAFIFPVLKEREWEEEDSGQAATSILLLQDLFVAPLLVILPYIVGQGVTDYAAIGFLTAKATLGFGAVLWVGSAILNRIFRLVAQAKSAETFVALSLLVSVGMGVIAKVFGLTDTAGAFAAGILLANSNYRSQIQADILPFKGILLGIFFMGAGSSFDLDLVLQEFPTIVAGSIALILIKAATLGLATRVPRRLEPNRLPAKDGMRVALLLAGGGEFAFVVLAAAEKLEVLPDDLTALLTAIILITMSATPLLGDIAAFASEPFTDQITNDRTIDTASVELPRVAKDAVVICGFGEAAQSLLPVLQRSDVLPPGTDGLSSVVVFDSDPALFDVVPKSETVVVYGDPSNPEVLRSSGVTSPRIIFVTHEEHALVLGSTSRLRTAFGDATPIYARAETRSQAESLREAGATHVIVESEGLAQSAPSLISTNLAYSRFAEPVSEVKQAATAATGISEGKVDELLQIFQSLDQDGSGLINADELVEMVSKSSTNAAGVASDEEVEKMNNWLRKEVPSSIDAVEFCRMFVTAPEDIQERLREACSTRERITKQGA